MIAGDILYAVLTTSSLLISGYYLGSRPLIRSGKSYTKVFVVFVWLLFTLTPWSGAVQMRTTWSVGSLPKEGVFYEMLRSVYDTEEKLSLCLYVVTGGPLWQHISEVCGAEGSDAFDQLKRSLYFDTFSVFITWLLFGGAFVLGMSGGVRCEGGAQMTENLAAVEKSGKGGKEGSGLIDWRIEGNNET